jgi:hypothetical protein
VRKTLTALALGATLLVLAVAATASAQEEPDPPTLTFTAHCLDGQPQISWTIQFSYDAIILESRYRVGNNTYIAYRSKPVAAGETVTASVTDPTLVSAGQTAEMYVVYAPAPYSVTDPQYTIYSEVVTVPDCSGGTTTTSTTTSTTTTLPTTTTTTTPPAPSCDCSGRQVTTDKPSKLLERVEKNKTGLTCFNVRLLDAGTFLVSGSGTDEALNRVFG